MKKKAIILAGTMMALGFLGGCEKTQPMDSVDGQALVIIAGKHANAYDFSDGMLQTARETIKASFSKYEKDEIFHGEAEISFIVSDGYPDKTKPTLNGKKIELSTKGYYLEQLDENIEDIADQLVEFLNSDELMANDKEVDLLGAISEAAAILNKSDREDKYLLIMDTGITTAGVFDMRNIENYALSQEDTAENIVETISESGFPDLSGITVDMIGIGNAAGYQESPSNNNFYTKNLGRVWSLIVKNCHGSLANGDFKYGGDRGEHELLEIEGGNGYPHVSSVKITEPVIAKEDSSDSRIVLQNTQLTFKSNSSEFKDKDVAVAEIGNYVETLRDYFYNHPSATDIVYVVGSIATDFDDRPRAAEHHLSGERADAVKAILVEEFNMPIERLEVINAGATEFSWRDTPEFVNGECVEANQEKDRVVALILSTDLESVAELRQGGYVN